MEDESGLGGEEWALPKTKTLPLNNHIMKLEKINPSELNVIAHLFEHYKDLEEARRVKVLG